MKIHKRGGQPNGSGATSTFCRSPQRRGKAGCNGRSEAGKQSDRPVQEPEQPVRRYEGLGGRCPALVWERETAERAPLSADTGHARFQPQCHRRDAWTGRGWTAPRRIRLPVSLHRQPLPSGAGADRAAGGRRTVIVPGRRIASRFLSGCRRRLCSIRKSGVPMCPPGRWFRRDLSRGGSIAGRPTCPTLSRPMFW